MSNKELLKSLPFEVAARLPLQLGRESIASSIAAITELIKNSYDANAENVRLSFKNLALPVSRIEIEDDGDGMDIEMLENVWLKIGTEHKSQSEHSTRKRRVLTGAKGLGRLGIDRLCSRAILQTKTPEMDHVLEVHINWRRYSDLNATLSGVTHKIFKVPFQPLTKHSDFFAEKNRGTRLILLGLKEHWSQERISEVRQELSMLVSPFSDIKDFAIDLRTPIEDLNGTLTSEKFLEAATWSISATIDSSSNVSATYKHKDGEVHNLLPTPWAEWMPDRTKAPESGPLKVTIFYIPQPDSEISPSINRKTWSGFMKLQHGIRIYKDEFRVRPYGEPSGRGDWLNLGIRKASSPAGIRQGGWRVGPRQLVGAVFISRLKNPNLIDQANREGMVETAGYFDLRAFMLKVVSEFESLATEHARRTAPVDPLHNITKHLDDSIAKSEQAVASLSQAMQHNKPPGQNELNRAIEEMRVLVEQTRKASEVQKLAYESKKDELEREKNTLANLASIGIMTVSFGHEAKEFCNFAATAAVELKSTYEEGKLTVSDDIKEDFLDDLDTIIVSTRFIKSFASFSLGNVSKEKRRKGPVNIFAVAQRVMLALDEALARQNITVDLSLLNQEVVIEKAYEIDWESIVVNMISNSMWAMTKTRATDRKISISANQVPDAVEVRFKDSGCGIEKGTEKYIFDPMYSTRRDEKGNTVGTGMGLSIIKTFISEHSGGHIKVLPKSDLGGAEFIISIPTR